MADPNQQQQKQGNAPKQGLNFATGIEVNRASDADVVSAGINGLSGAIGFGLGAVMTVLSFFGIKRSKTVGKFVNWLTRGSVDMSNSKPSVITVFDVDRRAMGQAAKENPAIVKQLESMYIQAKNAAGITDDKKEE